MKQSNLPAQGINLEIEFNGATPATAQSLQKQLAQMRPTLVIGAGGTGQMILTFLKAILEERLGTGWRERLQLLAFDTAEEIYAIPNGSEMLVSLENAVEFFHIGNVPVASIKRNIKNQAVIQERLGAIMSNLPPVVLRSGAKQLRPFGLLSLLWNYGLVSEQIGRALWNLAGRSQFDATALTQQQGINVFICGSLVGGTGSGIILDMAHLVRAFFTDLGSQADFCHITGIGVLPQAFHGISGPSLLPNTGAFLQELNYLMVQGGFQARYPDGRFIQAQEPPFDIFHAIDGVDARGQTWADIRNVSAMAAEGIYLQMGTQLGRKGENAFDNLDEVLSGQSEEGQGHFLGSFGKGDLVFDAPAVANLHTRWFLLELLQENWLQPQISQPATSERPIGQPFNNKRVHRPPGGSLNSAQLLTGLTAEQVYSKLLRDPESNNEMLVEVGFPAWLRRKTADEVAGDAAHYVQEFGLARIQEGILPAISENAHALAQTTKEQWREWVADLLFSPDTNLATVIVALKRCRDEVSKLAQATQTQATVDEQQLLRLTEALTQTETAVSRAASSFPLGRKGRIETALKQYMQSAQAYYEARVMLTLHRKRYGLWIELTQWLQKELTHLAALRERLTMIAEQLAQEAPQRLVELGEEGLSTLSLAEPDYVLALYQQHKPGWSDVQSRLRARLGERQAVYQMSAEQLQQKLLLALAEQFAAVARIGIEQVLREQVGGYSPRARRQQLFRLATPSWNLDRARLADGGAGLVRLEVLGVPNADNTQFEGEPMLVSTHDPYRLTALVVAAGAPASALQQFDLYQQAIDTNQGKRPLFILPDFLATSDEGKLIFALGFIFGFIHSEGTFFKYRPADPLRPSVKLANGLGEAIHTFEEQEKLVLEVSERVNNHIAELGREEAITILTNYYSTKRPDAIFNESLRELKFLVRDYTDNLRIIDDFNASAVMSSPALKRPGPKPNGRNAIEIPRQTLE